MKAGGEFFVNPATAAQRRYESLRAYLYDDEPAETVAGRFGYTPATGVRQFTRASRHGWPSTPSETADLVSRPRFSLGTRSSEAMSQTKLIVASM